MLYIRSLAFNLAFYASTIVQLIFWAPFYFLAPRRSAWFVPNSGRAAACGSTTGSPARKARSRAGKPAAGSFIRRRSTSRYGDTIAFFPFLQDPLYILKRN